jgi:hypothetical protein
MKLTFSHNGREMSMERMIEAMQREAIDKGMQAYEEKARGVASSIVDPETGKHADVFVRRSGERSWRRVRL